MRKDVFAVLKEDGRICSAFYEKWPDFIADTFSPGIEVMFVTDFTIHGKGYEERKAAARDLAIECQYYVSEAADLSYDGFGILEDNFNRIGRSYGLLREFRENAIC